MARKGTVQEIPENVIEQDHRRIKQRIKPMLD
jgi:transposase-like protein